MSAPAALLEMAAEGRRPAVLNVLLALACAGETARSSSEPGNPFDERKTSASSSR